MTVLKTKSQLPGEPVARVRELESVWQAKDAERAVEGHTENAVMIYDAYQRQQGDESRRRPGLWFEFAPDLRIEKQFGAHTHDCIVTTWNSTFINPETNRRMRARNRVLPVRERQDQRAACLAARLAGRREARRCAHFRLNQIPEELEQCNMQRKDMASGEALSGGPFEAWGMADREIEQTLEAWSASFAKVYSAGPTFPELPVALPEIPADGRGTNAVFGLWEQLRIGSTRLSSPFMSGHMDTAPHSVAALTKGLVAALNNNLLFRELSPIGSRIEEDVIDFFMTRLGLDRNWKGTFASGGTVANLTALFAAMGGFRSEPDRCNTVLLVPEAAHLSLRKAGRERS